MVENAIKAKVQLVDIAVGKDVGFRYGDVATMIRNMLRAAKCALFCKPRGASRYE